MKTAIVPTAVLILSSAMLGCTTVDPVGDYAPACTAFAGDTIELKDGRFVWDKFTDARRVTADGKVEDQFPAHPMRGRYVIEKDKLILKPDAGGVTSVFYLVNKDGQNYVLNVVQHSEWKATGSMPTCALMQAARTTN